MNHLTTGLTTWEQAMVRARWLSLITGKRWTVKRFISGRWGCLPDGWPDLHAELFGVTDVGGATGQPREQVPA